MTRSQTFQDEELQEFMHLNSSLVRQRGLKRSLSSVETIETRKIRVGITSNSDMIDSPFSPTKAICKDLTSSDTSPTALSESTTAEDLYCIKEVSLFEFPSLNPRLNSNMRSFVPQNFADAVVDVPITPSRLVWHPVVKDAHDLKQQRLTLCIAGNDFAYDADIAMSMELYPLQQFKESCSKEYFIPSRQLIDPIRVVFVRTQWFMRFQQANQPFANDIPTSSNRKKSCYHWIDAGDYRIGLFVANSSVRLIKSDNCTIKLIPDHTTPTTDEKHDLLIAIIDGQRVYLDCYDALRKARLGRILQRNIYGEVYCGTEIPHRQAEGEERSASYHLPSVLKKVAIKIINCPRCDHVTSSTQLEGLYKPYQNENFLREVQAIHYLHDVLGSRQFEESFLPYQHILQDGYQLYLITDYLEQGCLLDYMTTHRVDNKLSEDEVKHVIKQVAVGLQQIHLHGMAHRDLSAENILIQGYLPSSTPSTPLTSLLDAQMLLVDFGQVCGQVHDRGNVNKYKPLPLPRDAVGKSMYHCPEMIPSCSSSSCTASSSQGGGGYQGWAVDSWQLGILMLVMLTGQPPFESAPQARHNSKQQAWFRRIKNRTLESQAVFWRDNVEEKLIQRELSHVISPLAMTILKKLLHVDPECRPRMDDILADPWLLSNNESCLQSGFNSAMSAAAAGNDHR